MDRKCETNSILKKDSYHLLCFLTLGIIKRNKRNLVFYLLTYCVFVSVGNLLHFSDLFTYRYLCDIDSVGNLLEFTVFFTY